MKIISYSISFGNDNEDFLTEYCSYGTDKNDVLQGYSSYDEFGLYMIRTVV